MLQAKSFHVYVLCAGIVGMTIPGCATSFFDTSLLKTAAEKTAALKPPILEGHATDHRAFRRSVSTRFELRAMRSADAWKDLDILKLPKTKLEIDESTALDDKTFETIAKDEKGTKYQFMITRDEEKRRWVVDDVLIRQKKKGTSATKSVTEVMDLLLTVREFLATLQDNDRSTILSTVNASLREPLEQMPDAWMSRLVERIARECESEMARRPEIQMNESDALVKMPSKNGFLLLKVAREDDQWLFSDIEVRQRKTDDHPGSVLRQARALKSVSQFLSAYELQDKTTLKTLCDPTFFSTSLEIGDLSMIHLPSAKHAPDDFEIRSFSGQLTIMVPDKAQIVQLDLTTPKNDDRKAVEKLSEGAVELSFVIRDITIFDRQTRKQQKLESAFTAPARAMLFVSALHEQNVPILRQLSTKEFSNGTWDRIDPALVSQLPMAEVPRGELTLQETDVRGDTTEMQFLSENGQICNIIMRSENGKLNVDDVQYPNAAMQVASLRNHLQVTIPIVELASAWRKQDLEGVKRSCSTDFNRLIWGNLKAVPEEFDRLPEMLLVPTQSTAMADSQATVELAQSGHQPVSVRLLKENSQWVIDEISVRQPDGVVFNIRQNLRQEIAQRFLDNPAGGIMQAGHETQPGGASGIVHAFGESQAPRRGNLTLPSSGKPKARSAMLPPGMDLTPAPIPKPAPVDGVLKFGPNADAEVSTQSAAATEDTAHDMSENHGDAEYDDLLYSNDAEAPQPRNPALSPLSDISQHPIEISVE
jgi:hypothetical protein